MRRAGLKIAALLFFLVAAAIVGFLGWVYWASERRVELTWGHDQLSHLSAPPDRGKYLVSIACARCHGEDLSGGREFDLSTVRSWASNLTSDRETGLGAWSDAQILDAIRRGIAPDGRILRAPMPRFDASLDAWAVIDYLRTTAPISKLSPPARLTWRGRLKAALGGRRPIVDSPLEKLEPLDEGKALAQVMLCASCHGENWAGGTFPEDANEPHVLSSNLTPDPVEGIGTWTAADFARALREGKTPQGRELSSAMPRFPVAAEDAGALYAFFKSVPPVHQHVFTPEAVRGNDLYVNRGCVICHGPDGKGPRADITRVGKEGDLEKLKMWIKDPASVKPGTQMPRMGIEDPRDLEAIARFVIELSR
ncbi:MAG TPA: c-type cytochrome [Planctomycetota bacterium]|nr:c-type cytochrome [Planctomycetota bacterium]